MKCRQVFTNEPRITLFGAQWLPFLGAFVVTHIWITCCSAAPTLDQRSSPYSPKPRATPATHCYSRNNGQSLKHYQLRLVSCSHERSTQRTRRTQQQVALTRDEQRRRHVVQISVDRRQDRITRICLPDIFRIKNPIRDRHIANEMSAQTFAPATIHKLHNRNCRRSCRLTFHALRDRFRIGPHERRTESGNKLRHGR